MKNIFIPFFLTLILLALPAAAGQKYDAASVERGSYIAKMGDCVACHTVPSHAPFAGGLPMQSPLGIIYSTNITPDSQYGIGTYDLKDFELALRKGIGKGGRRLYPAMPYTNYALMSDDDIRDLYAYFMNGIPAVSYKPPETKLSFPFNQRWAISIWNMLFLSRHSYQADPNKTDSWNRGAYIVQGAGHCGACHTPRNIFYSEKSKDEKSSSFLSGNSIDDWQAADLRGNFASGLGNWSYQDISRFLKTGHARGSYAFGSMAQAVEDSTQYLTQQDRDSIGQYLKSFKKTRENSSYDKDDRQSGLDTYPIEKPGAGLYTSLCAQCHQAQGNGVKEKYPSLTGNPVLLSDDPDSLIRIILEGGRAPKVKEQTISEKMPAYPDLRDQDIADLLYYIRNSWGNKAIAVSKRHVEKFRQRLTKNNLVKDRALSALPE